ncbi:nuclear RNA polymerase D1A [Artemisia annua]|uniref:DNA-directed RNA polymerase n=1 Tax=Artemisia annua TaxID=35608 RepID=A0A2U1QFF2_ARTAN|nr:nuclear RNA polymerase D1A [Artemisia annua]
MGLSTGGDTGLMDNEVYIEQKVPTGVLTSIRFKVLSEEDAEKASVKEITIPNEVTDPALGFPNPASQCHTCGAKDYRTCEGHIGLIKFPFTILHPYFLPEVAQILNKICPGCKNLKKTKKNGTVPVIQASKICKYCDKSYKDDYPSMKFKVSAKDVFGKSAISVEIVNPKKLISGKSLPHDYWDFVKEDSQQEEAFSSFSRKVLTHAQVYQILKDVDPSFLKGSLMKKNKIFMQNFPLTPNCHRVAEFGQNLTFDERTRAYRKMVGFRGTANELSTCVTDCIKLSKIRAEKPTIRDPDSTEDNPSKMHGLKYMKEVSLGKRTDFCFRLVCVGDPYIKLDEIGVPHDLAETMLVSEQLNSLNWERINASCGLRILQKGETFIRRRGGLVPVRYGDQLRIGDTVYRPLHDGDIVLVNRPPSIHPHSLIALRVKVLPISCVLSYNPLVCDPFRGDFDGDSLHGYIPQSLESRVELRELVSLENQLVDKQSGKNLISLSHDSLTGAHLMLEDGVFFNRPQLQQLQMFCRRQKLELPAVMGSSCLWTGRQLFSLVLDKDFDANVAETQIKNGEFVSLLNPSSCLQAGDDNIYSYLIRNFQGDEVLEFLHSAQELMIEWLSSRGFSVSLLDLYLSSDSKHNMMDEVRYGLYEAERQAHGQLLMVDGHQDFLTGDLTGNMTEKEGYSGLDSHKLCYEQQTSAALSRASAAAFKQVFRDVQNLIYSYATRENSFLSMLKAGSKGNMMKFVQHSMCVGYQHSLVPLSFHFPREFSCVSWNDHKKADSSFSSGVDRYVPYGVIKSSFLSGLNPMELFVHSVTNRDASFGGHADISGTLFRKLMFFMRDLYIAYDGTVRNCYGNQLVQFSYNSENAPGQSKSLLDKAECGAPVGSLAACAISEAAYGALDQPVSALENSPLLNLKKVLECGVKKLSGNKTASLFLSQKLKRWNNGFEYGAIDVKNHLEKLLLKDVVSLIKNGEFVSLLNPSSCLQAGDDNIYSYLIRNFKGDEVLEFLHSAQELMIEWLSSRGFSVSLLDLYLSSDSKHNMNDEVLYGLYEAERQAHGQLLMVDGHQDFLTGDLTGNMTEKEGYSGLDSDKMCYEQQTSAALSRASAAAFKQVFRDVQNLIYSYATRENSFLSMLKAGSKGNMMKFVQHSMCVGYQHSLVPLSFHFPREFSCVSWNDHKKADLSFSSGVDRYVPYGVIKSSFLSGLNPMELFVHSVTNRDASFGGHADISGTLFRKLMFFMRDLYIAYDGTVRNCYGNQLVQFSYNSENAPGQSKSLLDKAECGAPVGSLAACAISEAAYGALDQPVSALENSPLLNLKKVLECGVKKLSGNKTASLFLSQKLKRWNNGFEYGAIDVKNHLEKLLLKDVVSLVSIFYSPQTGKRARISPWVCYFGISKEVASSKQLTVEWIIKALKYKCADSASFKKLKLSLPKLEISSKQYPEDEDDAISENDKNIFITVQIVDAANYSLNILQDVVVPFFLDIVIKGFINVKKVDIVWKDYQKTSKHWEDNSGELYLRVFMSDNCDRRKFWRVLTDDCIQIMEMIDWERSHPDDIQDVILAQGIDAARNHFLRTLKSAIEDTGKNIVPEHLALAADCLSATGEFIPINAKGLSMQRSKANISAPFTQACFSNPSDCFVKAAKSEALDNLEGTIDALSWGKVPGLGTGGRFEILFSGEKHQIDKPVDVFSLLSKSIDTNEENKIETPVELKESNISIKKPAPLYPYPDFTADGSTDLMKMVLKKHISAEDIKRLAKDLKHILHRYDVNDKLSHDDKLVAWKALFFHPRRDEKIGIGLYEIKIGHNLYHGNTRCFMVERLDGTTEDFSYHKCIHHALKLIAPFEAKVYESRWLNGKE